MFTGTFSNKSHSANGWPPLHEERIHKETGGQQADKDTTNIDTRLGLAADFEERALVSQ